MDDLQIRIHWRGTKFGEQLNPSGRGSIRPLGFLVVQKLYVGGGTEQAYELIHISFLKHIAILSNF